jgi:carboxylesterase type B
VPVWRYRYFGNFSNLELFPGSGAYHGSDLNMVFGTAQDTSGLPNTSAENATSRYLMHAWATFARDPKRGLVDELGWPTYDSNSE